MVSHTGGAWKNIRAEHCQKLEETYERSSQKVVLLLLSRIEDRYAKIMPIFSYKA